MSSNAQNSAIVQKLTSSIFSFNRKILKFAKIVLVLNTLFGVTCNHQRYGEIIEYRKGMNVPSWKKDEYLDSKITESLVVLKEIGTDHVAVVPTWYQESKESSQIYPLDNTAIDSGVVNIITVAKEMGYSVMLKPHIDVEDGSFRGEIEPSDIEGWFSSYKDFILHYARIAQQTDVDIFCIGTELKNISSRNEWKEIIDLVRSIYQNSLIYAANWDEYPNVNFWEYVDFIGIDAYFPLAQSREATIEEYLENFELWLYQVDNFQRHMGKDIIIPEVGFKSVRGSGVTPYDWQYDGIMDEESQAHAYRSILETLQRKSWLAGIFFWCWDPILKEDSLGYTPYNKQAEEVLREYWGDE